MSGQLSWSIIKLFSIRNKYGFSFKDVVVEFPEKNPIYLAEILADMVDKGMLCKIARNNYHIIPLNADPETYMPERLQVAKYIMQDNEYYIGYNSALRIHGLYLQAKEMESKSMESRAIEYVVTKKQIRPTIRSIAGITFRFIYHDTPRFFGYDSIWINQLEKAMVSDLERTIVDIATNPQLCGGIVELGNAIYLAKERTDRDKLFNYFARNMNKSAKKRFLFLTDLLGLKWTSQHEGMLKELGSGFTLLDPSAPDQGRCRKRFGLKINKNPEQIKQKVLG